MSILFGLCRKTGPFIERQELLRLAAATTRYSSEGTSVETRNHIGMGFQPFYTHERSHLDAKPIIDRHGNMLSFDGRLDNYQDLCQELNCADSDIGDSSIVLLSFLHWGEACFRRFIGDWALALWSEVERTLYLARDHAGVRSLYYQHSLDKLAWSTVLDTFVVPSDRPPVSDEYVAAYLGNVPLCSLTPYAGVYAVLPAHYLAVRDDRSTLKPHWNWMIKSAIRYDTDTEYEDHFLDLFKLSIKRRTGPGAPILAHLSGGMDSTAIVCMADYLRRKEGTASGNLLDTVSYLDDSEPNWDERPYVTLTESRRGKVGIHIEPAPRPESTKSANALDEAILAPGFDPESLSLERRFFRLTKDGQYRAILSGIGGDEVLGGIPTPLPELATYLLAGKFETLMRQSLVWCLANRLSMVELLGQSTTFLVDLYYRQSLSRRPDLAWLTPHLQQICREQSRKDPVRTTTFGLRPSTVNNGISWWSVMESITRSIQGRLWGHEYRYPYLDRDLVEYLFSLSPEVLLRPGRRRSLMRNALQGIVPLAIIERRRKASLIRTPILSLRSSCGQIETLFHSSLSAQHGFIDAEAFLREFHKVLTGADSRSLLDVRRTVLLEYWLRAVHDRTDHVFEDHNFMINT
jgi:asparagine synthase (glutamine-hydrolysing)